jgi:UDP-GlcNAc:undecaprenyl-phosphate/decaprenyl-phosphate GlcNAc-1-phosphate transferase
MGDTGSMFLGFVLATTAIQTNQKSATTVAILVPILALGVPIADTLFAMTRRAARGAPLFSADRGHIHHRLLDLGFTQKQTVLLLYGASVVLGGGALVLTFASASKSILFLLALSAVGYLVLRKLGFIDLAGAQTALAGRKRNLEVRAAVRRVGEALRSARSDSDVWVGIRMVARALGASAVALELPGPRDVDEEPFHDGFDDAELELFRARYGLFPERRGDTHLEFGFDDGRTTIDRDTEIAIELLCEHVATALERVEREDAKVVKRAKVLQLAG